MHQIIIVVLSFILLFSCTKESINIKIKSTNINLIPSFHNVYALINQENKKQIGTVEINVHSYKKNNVILYHKESILNMEWKSKNYNKIEFLKIKTSSVTNSQFKLYTFNSTINKLTDKSDTPKLSIRSGFYNAPYFYIKENDVKSRIRAPNGIYSYLVEQYLIRHYLKEIGDAASYKFFNIITLGVEEERIVFEKKSSYSLNKKKMPIRIFETSNYTKKYNGKIIVDKYNTILEKTDFAKAVKWQLIKKK